MASADEVGPEHRGLSGRQRVNALPGFQGRLRSCRRRDLEVIAFERHGADAATPAGTAARLAPLVVRRDEDFFGIAGGWFQGRWHFRFDQHSDPDHTGIGALRVFNHDTRVPGAMWPMCPYRDSEPLTVTAATVNA